jgi:hypothetical protein
MRTLSSLLTLLAALGLSGCGDKGDPKPPKTDAGHEHTPPHGGEMLELGAEEGHLELMHDHDGGNVTVYVYDGAMKPVKVAAPTIVIQQKADKTKSSEFTLTAVNPGADGTSDTWKGSHEDLKADPWEGRIRLTIGGKAFQSPLEGPAHTHK